MASSLAFHFVHGSLVNLRDNRTVARTTSNVAIVNLPESNGIVFSDRNVQINEKICVKLLQLNSCGNVRLGFTQIDPSLCQNLLVHSSTDELILTCKFWIQQFPYLDFKQNSTLSFSVDEKGIVFLEIDGEDKGSLFSGVDTSAPLWAVMDLRGHSTSVQVINGNGLRAWLQRANDSLSWKTLPKTKQTSMQLTPTATRSSAGPESKTNGRLPSLSLLGLQTNLARKIFSFSSGLRPKPPSTNLNSNSQINTSNGRQPLSPLALQGNGVEPQLNNKNSVGDQGKCVQNGNLNTFLRLSNLPSGVTEIDIKKKFEFFVIQKIEISHLMGTAKLYFQTDQDVSMAYNESELVRLGQAKMGWLRPEELYVEDVPRNGTVAEILKDFDRGKKVKFQNGEGGKRIATIIFVNNFEQKKAYENSHMVRLGPQRLGWTKKEAGGGKVAQLRLTNIQGSTISKNEIQAKFPGAVIKVDSGPVIIQFKSVTDAEKAYEESDLLKLGNKTLGWLQPYELYIQDVAGSVNQVDLLKSFPTAKKLSWQQHDKSGKRILTIEFANEGEQRRAYHASNYQKFGRQILVYGKTTTNGDTSSSSSSSDAELAKTLWEIPEVGYSNISHLFTPAIIISGLPATVTRLTLLRLFPAALKIDIVQMAGGKGPVAQIEFDSPVKAAHAYGVSKNLVLDGHQLVVQPVRVGGSQRRNRISVS